MKRVQRFTIQEIIDDLRMTSTTTNRYPIKAKSLTLLELCQTINDLRHTSPQNTSQILTRRLYLHPLTISTNAKQHTSRLTANNSYDFEQYHQRSLRKHQSLSRRRRYHNLSVLSTSVPLTTRPTTKLNTSRMADHDTMSSITTASSTDFEASTTSISTNHISLPPIASSASSKRTISTRSTSYVAHHPKLSTHRKTSPPPPPPTADRWEKIDAWRHLAHALQRPIPVDPPTSPLDTIIDSQNQSPQNPNLNTIHHIEIYRRKPRCTSTVNENDDNENEDEKA